MPDSGYYCEDCNTEFDTLTRKRLHDCDDHRDPEPELEAESNPEYEGSGRFAFEGEVETWSGTVEATFQGSVNEQAHGRDCALCGDDAAVLLRPTMEWDDILREEHDDYTPISGYQQIPLCPPCHIRLESLRDAEKEMGYMDDDARADIEAKRREVLRDLDPNAIFMDESMMA
jgi:hypothetical protein